MVRGSCLLRKCDILCHKTSSSWITKMVLPCVLWPYLICTRITAHFVILAANTFLYPAKICIPKHEPEADVQWYYSPCTFSTLKVRQCLAHTTTIMDREDGAPVRGMYLHRLRASNHSLRRLCGDLIRRSRQDMRNDTRTRSGRPIVLYTDASEALTL